MSFIEAAYRAGFIPSATVEALVERLKAFPPSNPVATSPHSKEDRLQGDVFRDFPFIQMKSDGQIAVRERICVVLNNACDLQPERSERCNLALAVDYEVFSTWQLESRGEASARDFLKEVEANGVSELFYIPSAPLYARGLVVLLDCICTVPFGVYEDCLANGKRLSSLTQDGFWSFLASLTHYLARAESPEIARTVA